MAPPAPLLAMVPPTAEGAHSAGQLPPAESAQLHLCTPDGQDATQLHSLLRHASSWQASTFTGALDGGGADLALAASGSLPSARTSGSLPRSISMPASHGGRPLAAAPPQGLATQASAEAPPAEQPTLLTEWHQQVLEDLQSQLSRCQEMQLAGPGRAAFAAQLEVVQHKWKHVRHEDQAAYDRKRAAEQLAWEARREQQQRSWDAHRRLEAQLWQRWRRRQLQDYDQRHSGQQAQLAEQHQGQQAAAWNQCQQQQQQQQQQQGQAPLAGPFSSAAAAAARKRPLAQDVPELPSGVMAAFFDHEGGGEHASRAGVLLGSPDLLNQVQGPPLHTGGGGQLLRHPLEPAQQQPLPCGAPEPASAQRQGGSAPRVSPRTHARQLTQQEQWCAAAKQLLLTLKSKAKLSREDVLAWKAQQELLLRQKQAWDEAAAERARAKRGRQQPVQQQQQPPPPQQRALTPPAQAQPQRPSAHALAPPPPAHQLVPSPRKGSPLSMQTFSLLGSPQQVQAPPQAGGSVGAAGQLPQVQLAPPLQAPSPALLAPTDFTCGMDPTAGLTACGGGGGDLLAVGAGGAAALALDSANMLAMGGGGGDTLAMGDGSEGLALEDLDWWLENIA